MKDTLFAIGETIIDFIPNKYGCDFAEIDSFSPKIGGAPLNVLGAFAKLGGKTQLITQLGNDPFAKNISSALSHYNIGSDFVMYTDKANTALAFVSLEKNGNRSFSFYRNPSADMLYNGENLKSEDFKNCYALHFCSVSLGDFPMKDAHKKAIAYAKENNAIISFDLNIRLPLWKNEEKLRVAINEFLPYADIIKVSDEEITYLANKELSEQKIKKYFNKAKLVLYTCGSNGAYAITDNVLSYSPSISVDACDTTGAGDAFCGSFLYNLYRNNITKDKLSSLSEDVLKEFLQQSNAYCAKSVCKYGSIDSYPNEL